MLPRSFFLIPVALGVASLVAIADPTPPMSSTPVSPASSSKPGATLSRGTPETAGKPQARLALGEPAPEIAATLADKPIALAGLRNGNPGKIIVLQFGSITDPIFRSHAAAVENLAEKFADRAAFFILYQREAHAADSADPLELNHADGFDITEPVTLAERQNLAAEAGNRLHIKQQTILVDAWNNTSTLRYGSYPNMTFIIDVAGNLQAGYPWMDPAKVKAALTTLVAGNPLPPELRGSVQHTGPAPFDSADAAMEMTGGRGPANIANALDHMALTDAQKQALYPAIASFMADLQEFRQTANALPSGPRGRGRGPAAPGAGGGAPPMLPPQQGNGGTTPKVSTPGEVQTAQIDLRASATKLETTIKQALPPKDAAQLLKALQSVAPQQRLFTGQ